MMVDIITITVFTQSGSALILFKPVADELGHWPGKRLTDDEVWTAIALNAAAGIASCEWLIAARTPS